MADRVPFAPMVRWFGPAQLARTAVNVATSTLLGADFDRRRIDAQLSQGAPIHDLTHDASGAPRTSLVIDYIADTGDGWNSTYAIAHAASLPTLEVATAKGEHRVTTRRGDVLVFGGDEVYPTPTRGAYDQRLVMPFECALAWTDGPDHPVVFAIPGNHDWYDNLAAFTRLFIDKEWFGGRRAPQRRSYFALRLPHGWWLVGVDIQLASDIDNDQVEYFKEVANQMRVEAKASGVEAKVLLCTAEPHWVFEHEKSAGAALPEGPPQTPVDRLLQRRRIASNLHFLEEQIFGAQAIRVFLAGDLHHYRRHSSDGERIQKITAGGGGAFLHPTHHLKRTPLPGGFHHRASFPDHDTSRRLAWRNLLFPVHSPTFGALTGALYLLFGWHIASSIDASGALSFLELVHQIARALAVSPAAFTAVATVMLGFVLFTDTHKVWYRIVGGTTHALAHLIAAAVIAFFATDLAVGLGCSPLGLRHMGITIVALFAGGWWVGSHLMGLYLLGSLNIFGRHYNEAFSGLAIEDHKHFLRMIIEEDGSLTILPIAIDRVPRAWEPAPAPERTRPLFHPAPGQGTPARLIEAPIRVPR